MMKEHITNTMYVLQLHNSVFNQGESCVSKHGRATDLNRPVCDSLLPILQLLHHDSVVGPVQLLYPNNSTISAASKS
jgi:hypothetical protein